MGHSLSEITGIDPRVQSRLETLDIRTVEQLVKRTRAPAQTVELARAIGIPLTQLTTLVNRGDLLRLDGVDDPMVDLLARVGVDSVEQLAQACAQSLQARLSSANMQWQLAPAVPNVAQSQCWIDQARNLTEQELTAGS